MMYYELQPLTATVNSGRVGTNRTFMNCVKGQGQNARACRFIILGKAYVARVGSEAL